MILPVTMWDAPRENDPLHARARARVHTRPGGLAGANLPPTLRWVSTRTPPAAGRNRKSAQTGHVTHK